MSYLPILTFLLLLLLHLTCHRTEARHERRYPELKKHHWHDKAAVNRINPGAGRSTARHHHHGSTTQSPYDAVLRRLPHREQSYKSEDYDGDDLTWFFGKPAGQKKHHLRFNADIDDYANSFDSFDDENDDIDEDYGFSPGRSRKHQARATTLAPRNLDSRRDLLQTSSDSDDDEYYDDEESRDEAADAEQAEPKSGFSLTEYKWKHFGTRENVERQYLRQQQQYRRPYNHDVDRQHSEQATAHMRRMSKALRCGLPLARVINVRAEHPHAAKSYLPRCTLLHRCGEDAGCCRDDEICAPSKTQKVHLYFHSQTLGSVSNVERLSFVNHTECACMDRRVVRVPEPEVEPESESAETRTEPSFQKITATVAPTGQVATRHTTRTSQGLSRRSAGRDDDEDSLVDEDKLQKEQQDVLRRCRCPSQFSAHLLQDGECQCDCFEGQKDCARIKRGKEYFGMMDRICIQRGECRLPRCEFGAYQRQSGRCPRRHEKLEAMGRFGH